MNSNSECSVGDPSSEPAVCRMVRWFRAQHEAEDELGRLLGRGWVGSLHDCGDVWQVDVVRPLR